MTEGRRQSVAAGEETSKRGGGAVRERGGVGSCLQYHQSVLHSVSEQDKNVKEAKTVFPLFTFFSPSVIAFK